MEIQEKGDIDMVNNLVSEENNVRVAAEKIITEILEESITDPQMQLNALVKLGAAIFTLIAPNAVQGICGICGGELQIVGREDGLYYVCSFDTNHFWKR